MAIGYMAGYAQNAHVLAIGMQVTGQNTRCVRGFQHHGTGAITKQYAGGAVIEIQQTGKHFSSDHQRLVGRASLDHGVSDREGIHKTAAHGLNIKRRAAIRTQLVLQDAGGRGEYHVRRGRGHNDQVNVFGFHTSSVQRTLQASRAKSLL